MAHFEHRFKGFIRQIVRTFVHSFFAAGAAGVAAYLVLSLVGPLTFASTTASVLTRGFVAGVIGIIVAALSYALVGNREWEEMVATVYGHFVRKGVAPAEVAIATSAEESNPSIPQ
jgi:hypothetical protein